MPDVHKTEIAVILDRSGSMISIKQDMEGGFAQFVAVQRAEPGQCSLSLYQFDDQYEVVYEERPLCDVPELSIVPRGSTALLDAVGRSMARVGERLADKPEHERPGVVIVMVITDGQENASHEVSRRALKAAIKVQQRRYNWRFMYLGADASAFSEAASLGIQAAARYSPDSAGVDRLYAASSVAVPECRSRVSAGEEHAEIEIAKDLTSKGR
jgi:hypothetical protein